MKLTEYQEKVRGLTTQGKPLNYLIAELTSKAGELSAAWGSFEIVHPSEVARWDVTKAHMVKALGEIIQNITEISNLLKLDLDVDVFAPTSDVKPTPTLDVSLLVIGVLNYVCRLNSIYAGYLKDHEFKEMDVETLGTNVRIGKKDDLGPSILKELIAISSSITDLIRRISVKFDDLLSVNLYVLNTAKAPVKK